MERIEAAIRDYLASHLEFISDDLTFLKKEQYLENELGSPGFIDILAEDEEGNFVIIELKRTKKSSRETLQELLKYANLLRQKYKVRPSEIRLIVISTNWNELLAPFSEAYNQFKYPLEGYKIFLDDKNIPVCKERVESVEDLSIVNISPNHFWFACDKFSDLSNIISCIRVNLKQIGITDFVIIPFKTENQNAPYPYFAYLVFQRYHENYYYNININSPELVENIKPYKLDKVEDGQERIRSYELAILGLLTHKVEAEDVGDSNPDIFANFLYNKKIFSNIVKEGFFATDPRSNNKKLFREILGLLGSNIHFYSNNAKSDNKHRLNEVEKTIFNCVRSCKVWKEDISQIINSVMRIQKSFRLSTNVYHPGSGQLIEAILLGMNPEFYLPYYTIEIEFGNEMQKYEGRVKWDGTRCDFDEFLKKFYKGKPENYRRSKLNFDWRLRIEPDIMSYMGLRYSSDLTVIHEDTKRVYLDTVKPNDELATTSLSEALYIEDFIKANQQFLRKLGSLHYSDVVSFQ
ncbi:MAG: DUF91 domain-containing protein [Chloroflexi bacterium]|nr:DUF91 domain-containing protein [Chloroflexota bacterium]